MSVTFRYSTKGRNGNFISKVCFGRSLQMDALENYNGYLWRNDFLDYKVDDQIYDYDFNICLDRINQIVEKFPWMKDIFVLQSDDDGTYYRFDLSKPADTVWFCLNLVRLILKGMESLLPVPTYNKMLDSMDGDLWNKIVFINSVHFDEERSGKGLNRISTGKYCLNSFPYQTHTCLLSPFFVSKETIQAVLEDPIKVLNKLPSVIESKTGFKPIVGSYDDESGEFSSDVSEYCDEAYSPMQLVMEDFHTKMIDPSEIESLRKHSGNHLLNVFNLNEDELRIFEKSVGE